MDGVQKIIDCLLAAVEGVCRLRVVDAEPVHGGDQRDGPALHPDQLGFGNHDVSPYWWLASRTMPSRSARPISTWMAWATIFQVDIDRKSTRLNSSHLGISY